MFEDEEALWALTVSSGVLVGLLFLPWLWLHFFLSIDFLIWIVLPSVFVFPILFEFKFSLLSLFSRLGISYFDFTGNSFTFTEDSFILLIVSCWFWQKFLWTSFSNSIIFLSLYFNSFWKALFIFVIFYNLRRSSWFFAYFSRSLSS
jgi:hypothetical protein